MDKKTFLFVAIFIVCIGYYTENLYAKEKTLNWGLNIISENSRPEIDTKAQSILSETNSTYIGSASARGVYLTFDTGYEIGNTALILDTLRDRGVSAVFFITGHFIKTHPDLVVRMSDEGHFIGNHTYGHPDITSISKEELIDEITSLEEEFYKLTNRNMDKLFRPPMGKYNRSSLETVSDAGYTTVFWSLAYVDWEIDNQRGWEHSYSKVMERVHNGAVILMHTVSTDNKDALGKIIDDLRADEYEFYCPSGLKMPFAS